MGVGLMNLKAFRPNVHTIGTANWIEAPSRRKGFVGERGLRLLTPLPPQQQDWESRRREAALNHEHVALNVGVERLDAGEPMPAYLADHCVYYAGPAKTPEGMASGSFGPTTAGRMDSYVEQFQAAGGSFVMLAKGNRSRQVTDSCHEHGGFYLGSIGGPAARLAQDNITSVEVLEYPELGMEAVWRIEVRDFPAFIVVDDKGNDFYDQVRREAATRPTGVSIG